MSEDHLNELIDNPIATVQRWAMGSVQAKLNSIEHRLAEQSTEANRQRVMNALNNDQQLGSTWRQINNDPEFIKWLNQVDPLAGVPRMQLLTTAYNHGAADRVGNLFRAFLASRIPSRERTSTRLPHEGTGPRPAVRASAGVNEARRRVFAKGEIAKFYDECRRGVYDKREDERGRIEQEIFKAAQQGRVADNAVQPKHRGQLF